MAAGHWAANSTVWTCESAWVPQLHLTTRKSRTPGLDSGGDGLCRTLLYISRYRRPEDCLLHSTGQPIPLFTCGRCTRPCLLRQLHLSSCTLASAASRLDDLQERGRVANNAIVVRVKRHLLMTTSWAPRFHAVSRANRNAIAQISDKGAEA